MGARRNGQLPRILRRRSRAPGMEHGKSEVNSVTSFRPKYLLETKYLLYFSYLMTDVCYIMPQGFIKLPGSYFVKIVT